MSNLDLIRSTYEGSAEERGRNLFALLAEEFVWTEAEGFPYGGTYTSPQAVIANVFERLNTEWIDFRAEIERFVADGDTVVVFGWYTGTYRTTGRAMRAAVAHRWTLRDGRIVGFFQYVDSAMVRRAMIAA